MSELPSKLVFDIPEIICMIIALLDDPTLQQTARVCKAWHELSVTFLWSKLVIPKDWYTFDLSLLTPGLDRHGNHIKTISLELSSKARMLQEFDTNQMVTQLSDILSRTPNVENLEIKVPRGIESNLLGTVAKFAKNLKHFDTDILNWDSKDMTTLLMSCPALVHIAGHSFTGGLLESIAVHQPKLRRIDCTHPRFDDEELVTFASHFPDLEQLTVSLHQFLNTKALVGLAQYCHRLDHINLNFCLSLQSTGFQALLGVSPRLRVLDLGLTEVQDGDISLVAERCPGLEVLKLPFCSNISHRSIRDIVTSCPRLLHLDISFCDRVMLSLFESEEVGEEEEVEDDRDEEDMRGGSEESTDAKTKKSNGGHFWKCLSLEHLDISGIHASYILEATMAVYLLPSMYEQLSQLKELRFLKISGHGFSLMLEDLGKKYLRGLRKLETLDISKPKNPLFWEDIIEIGNLFPNLSEFQFRSSDVICPPPPLLPPPPRTALLPQQPKRIATGRSAATRTKRRRVVVEGREEVEEEQEHEQDHKRQQEHEQEQESELGKEQDPENEQDPTLEADQTLEESLDVQPGETVVPATITANTDSKASDSIAEESKNAPTIDDSGLPEVMTAILSSGLKISFRLNGEDDENEEGGAEEGWGTMASKEWILEEENELRLEIDFDTKVKLRLVTGTAEIFGTELGQNVDYEFSGRKVAVFTWHGCKLQIQGTCSVEYIANETPMVSYLNTHLALEQRRVLATQNKRQGPRVLIVGPNDVGKTSLSKLLLSYALKQSRQPIYIDLDCSEGSITMPGCLTATPLTEMIDVEEGFGSSATSAPTAGSAVMPLAYYYGFPSPKDNVKLYTLLMSRLAQTVNRRLEEDEAARTSGVIIDTNGLIDATGYQVIAHCIKAFSVDVIVALGHERLYSDMVRLHQKSGVAVVKLAKSGGVVERDHAFRRQTQNQKIREYFYGTSKSELAPYSTMINYHDIEILRVGEGSLAPSSALPIGEDRKVSETHVVKVDPGDHLLHSVLAVSNAECKSSTATGPTEAESLEILEANLAGFIYVSQVHEARKKLTVLSPCPGRIPKKFWWLGSLKWAED
ncbi:Cleavage polyadenylation factor subunit clp1 [Podila humilis]|nr:Cleavage polyadenylation factor subunit clp1 [Podila humilis]